MRSVATRRSFGHSTEHKPRRVLRPRGAPAVLTGLLAVAALVSACGGDDEPQLTIEEQLVEIEGRPMGPSEIEERLAVGETLCQMSDTVLDAIWFELDDDQLDFQDLVFGRLCPERSVFYASRTGRYVTDEATESGVVTSTTRPASTTSTVRTTTTTEASTALTASSVPADGATTTPNTLPTNSVPTDSVSSRTASTVSRSATARTSPLSTATTSVGEGG